MRALELFRTCTTAGLAALACLDLAWVEPALAQEARPEADPQPAWRPPASQREGWDWIRMSSGEWLKGEITLMRDFDLEFDSDEFDELTVDWDDVEEIMAGRPHTYVLEDLRSYTGAMRMRDGIVTVDLGAGETESFERVWLFAIVPSTRRELNLWSLRASAGLALRSGNTDQAELTGTLNMRREGKNTRYGIDYVGNYGTLENLKNTNNHRGRTRLDYFLTRKFFLTPASFEVFSDEFQNISYRLTPSSGIGYYVVRRSGLEWQLTLGGGYQYTRLDSITSGDSATDENGAVIFGSLLDVDLTSDVDLLLQYQAQLVAPQIDGTNHHGEATLSVELTSAIDLDVLFIWDRIESPEKGSDGRTPKNDDFRLSVGLAFEY